MVVAVVLAVVASPSAPSRADSRPWGESRCSTPGQVRTVKGKASTCTKTPNGLIWRTNAAKPSSGTASGSWSKKGPCQTNNIHVTPPVSSSRGAFTHAPFDVNDVRIIVNGGDGGGADPRFAYVTVATPDQRIALSAPAPMLLVKIRPKDSASVPNRLAMRATDWDLFFVVSCDTQIRINHVTEPSQRIRDAWGFPGLFGTWWLPDGTQVSADDRQVPTRAVVFQPGDLIGYTQGTLQASNFDYVVAVNDYTVCPWSVFDEPIKTALLGKLGPKPLSPSDGPVPGWPCQGYGGHM